MRLGLIGGVDEPARGIGDRHDLRKYNHDKRELTAFFVVLAVVVFKTHLDLGNRFAVGGKCFLDFFWVKVNVGVEEEEGRMDG